MDDLLTGASLQRYERDGYLPYWADVWPASVCLARHLVRGPSLDGLRVLDLGCGVGVAGIGARRMGAEVTFADLDPDALAFAEFNARNNPPSIGNAAFSTMQFDWNATTVPGVFDRLLLADVSYEKVNHDPLLRHLRACLAPGGVALQADPFRKDSDIFVARLEAEFRVTITTVETSFDEQRVPLRLVTIEARA
jgi:predicted nicotinamide N-methyase